VRGSKIRAIFGTVEAVPAGAIPIDRYKVWTEEEKRECNGSSSQLGRLYGQLCIACIGL
jgi:hypothetical protein